MSKIVGIAVLVIAIAVPAGGAERTAGGASGGAVRKPATTRPGRAAASKPAKTPKYEVPTDEQVQQSESLMTSVVDLATKEVNPKLHKVESPHFIIFSGLPPTVDKGIAKTMERMYDVLCKQFDIEADERVWVGKCGIFLLSDSPDRQFFNFATKVDHLDPRIGTGAAGYFHSTAIQSYIVMPPPPNGQNARETDAWKCTLVHESTHAFLYRYITNKQVPLWLNEGIANTIAFQIMGSRLLDGQMRQANQAVLAPGNFTDPSPVFQTVGLTSFDYGIAQSWVRFLVVKDQKAFLKFVALCKQGTEDEEAMKEAYKLSHREFLRIWAEWAKNMR